LIFLLRIENRDKILNIKQNRKSKNVSHFTERALVMEKAGNGRTQLKFDLHKNIAQCLPQKNSEEAMKRRQNMSRRNVKISNCFKKKERWGNYLPK
jgi:hypothetical protein